MNFDKKNENHKNRNKFTKKFYDKKVKNFFAFLGLIYFVNKSKNIFLWTRQYFFTKRKDFLKTYGNGWVFITGSSEGIGKAFAEKFAKENCNIILSARNEETLKKRQEEILKINPKIKVNYLVYDNSKNFDEKNILDFKEKIKNYEINILINNAGAVSVNHFEKLSSKEISEMINVNINSTTMITQIILGEMKKRKFKSLIVSCGSDLTLYNPPYIGVYTATKSYIKSLTASLQQENEGQIDLHYLDIGPVNTRLNSRKIAFKLEPDEFVDKAMNQFGNYSYSNSHYWHAFKYVIFGNAFMMDIFTRKSLKKEFYPKI